MFVLLPDAACYKLGPSVLLHHLEVGAVCLLAHDAGGLTHWSVDLRRHSVDPVKAGLGVVALLGLSSVAVAYPGTTPDGYTTKTTTTKDGGNGGGKTCTKIQTTSKSVGSTVYTS